MRGVREDDRCVRIGHLDATDALGEAVGGPDEAVEGVASMEVAHPRDPRVHVWVPSGLVPFIVVTVYLAKRARSRRVSGLPRPRCWRGCCTRPGRCGRRSRSRARGLLDVDVVVRARVHRVLPDRLQEGGPDSFGPAIPSVVRFEAFSNSMTAPWVITLEVPGDHSA